MQVGDVVTAIAKNEIDQNGNYVDPLYGKIDFTNLLTAHAFAGDTVPFQIQRNGKPMQLKLTLEHRDANDYVMSALYLRSGATLLSFWAVLFFKSCRASICENGAPNWQREAPPHFVYLDRFQSELFPQDHRKVVVLSQVLPVNATIGYEDLAYLSVKTVNGREIRSLEDLAEAVKQPVEGGFIKIETEEDPKQIELDVNQVAAEAADLQENYGIPSLQHLD